MRPMMHEGRDRGGSRYVALHARTRDIFRTQDTYPPDKPSRRRGGRKVLVVDDQPDALDSTVELFSEMGYDVLQASSGSGTNGAAAVTTMPSKGAFSGQP